MDMVESFRPVSLAVLAIGLLVSLLTDDLTLAVLGVVLVALAFAFGLSVRRWTFHHHHHQQRGRAGE